MSIDNTINRMGKKTDERTTKEKIAALRHELHEIYKRAQQGRELPTDNDRAGDIGFQIHELQGGEQ
jgi:hypothetical protein